MNFFFLQGQDSHKVFTLRLKDQMRYMKQTRTLVQSLSKQRYTLHIVVSYTQLSIHFYYRNQDKWKIPKGVVWQGTSRIFLTQKQKTKKQTKNP